MQCEYHVISPPPSFPYLSSGITSNNLTGEGNMKKDSAREKGQMIVDMIRWLATELIQDRSPNAKGNRTNTTRARRRKL